MKALILAAGFGSRLAPLTDNYPKSLIQVNGESILIKQIKNLHANGITDITIISGYMSEVLEKAVHEKYPEIRIIKSVDYASTNNMYSAYLAKDILKDNAFLMMNADVFFDSSIVSELLRCDAPDAIVTDAGTFLEESMKVICQNGRLVKISKDISVEEAYGTSIDVYKFSAKGGQCFFNKCTEYIERKKLLNLWSEVALNDILSDVVFRPCPLSGRWIEIDTLEDLKSADDIFSK